VGLRPPAMRLSDLQVAPNLPEDDPGFVQRITQSGVVQSLPFACGSSLAGMRGRAGVLLHGNHAPSLACCRCFAAWIDAFDDNMACHIPKGVGASLILLWQDPYFALLALWTTGWGDSLLVVSCCRGTRLRNLMHESRAGPDWAWRPHMPMPLEEDIRRPLGSMAYGQAWHEERAWNSQAQKEYRDVIMGNERSPRC